MVLDPDRPICVIALSQHGTNVFRHETGQLGGRLDAALCGIGRVPLAYSISILHTKQRVIEA